METTTPRLAGTHIVFAKDQPQYRPLPAVLVDNPRYEAANRDGKMFNTVVCAFAPSQAQRERLAAGEAIYLAILTYGNPLQPVNLFVGAEETAEAFGLETVANT